MGLWDNMMKESVYLADLTGKNNSGDPTYGAARQVIARIERDVWNKTFFDGQQRDLFTKVAINEELAPNWEGIVWLPEDDESDASEGRNVYICRPVKDVNGVFSHTILEF